MRAQVIVNDDFLKRHCGIYRYSIVDIISHNPKKGNKITSYQIRYKGSPEIRMFPRELNILED